MSIFGSIGKWVGKGLKGVGKVAGIVPGIGGLAGSIASGVGGLLDREDGGEGGGGGVMGNLAKLLGIGVGGAQVVGDYKQSKKDSKYARALADEALENYRSARSMAQDRWASQSPLRDAFNFGAFNMSDPTNPFSRGNDMFKQFQPQPMGEEVGRGQTIEAINSLPGNSAPPGGAMPGGLSGLLGINPQDIMAQRDQAMNRIQGSNLFGLFGRGGRSGGGQPTNRSASVKSGRNAQAQDRGRDRSRGDMDEGMDY